MNRDQLTERLRATFAAELAEQLVAANRHLLALETDTSSAEDLRALFRVVHTLKGAARVAGIPDVESVCHDMESLLAEMRDGQRALDATSLKQLFLGLDQLQAVANGIERSNPSAARPAKSTGGEQEHVDPESHQPVVRPADAAEQVFRDRRASSDAVVRVTQDRIDTLLDRATMLTMRSGEIAEVVDDLAELRDSVLRVATEWRQLRAHFLATDRQGNGRASADIATSRIHSLDQAMADVQRESVRLAEQSSSVARSLEQLSGTIGRGVRELRLRPFADAIEQLPRAVRDVAAETGKLVRLEIRGHEIEMDRAVLEELRDAILHLVRNAVDHGIELPSTREALGKPREGTIVVSAGIAGDHVVVTVDDDGAGLDISDIRRIIVERGGDPPANDRELARVLFQGGFTTRKQAGAISGRGVGLDAVLAAMRRARGGVDVTWGKDRGTRFTLDAPLTFATMRAFLVRVGGAATAAIPTAFVERLVRLAPEQLRSAAGRTIVELDSAPVPVLPLARLLGPPLADRPVENVARIIVMRAGERRLGLTVDEFLGEQEIVVRSITARGGHPLLHITGASLLADGSVALVLNASAVMSTGLESEGSVGIQIAQSSAAIVKRRRILVVDDSITTRTLEQSVLEAAGYDVEVAVDGADAWQRLQERSADLVVSDVEMPRMDGFALCEAIRSSTRFRTTPVILMTALESAKDRERGLEVGADAYLGKSSFDQEALLDTIRELLS